MNLRRIIKLFCIVIASVLCFSACLQKPKDSSVTDGYEDYTETFTPVTDKGESSEAGREYSKVASLVEGGEKITYATAADFTYSEVPGGVKITGYTGEYKSDSEDDYIILAIPDTIEGKSVVSIGKQAFAIVAHLDAVIIPDSVTDIESLAFYGCTYLKYVKIGANTKSVGNYAFAMCPALFEIDLSDAASIGLGALIGCNSLNTITLSFVGGGSKENSFLGYIFGASGAEFNKDFVPASLRNVILTDECRSIPDLAFYDCRYITSVAVSDTVESIGVRAFYKCRSLSEIDTGEGIKEIGDDAFFGCDILRTVKLGASLESLGMQAFFGCSALERVEIPATLSEIKASTFYGCTALKEIDLANVKTVGKDAFGGCEALTPPDISSVENIAEGNDKLYKPEEEK